MPRKLTDAHGFSHVSNAVTSKVSGHDLLAAVEWFVENEGHVAGDGCRMGQIS